MTSGGVSWWLIGLRCIPDKARPSCSGLGLNPAQALCCLSSPLSFLFPFYLLSYQLKHKCPKIYIKYNTKKHQQWNSVIGITQKNNYTFSSIKFMFMSISDWAVSFDQKSILLQWKLSSFYLIISVFRTDGM